MVFKFDELFYLSGRFFEFDFSIGFKTLLLMFLLRVHIYWKMTIWCIKDESRVNTNQSMSYLK